MGIQTGDDVDSSPAIGSDGTIYVGSGDNKLQSTTCLKKEPKTNGGVIPPAIGSDGTIYFGSDDDNLYAINPDGSKNGVRKHGTPKRT